MHCEIIGPAMLYLGDCDEVLRMIGAPDAILTDPPYGQRLKTNVDRVYRTDGRRTTETGARNVRTDKEPYPKIVGDDVPFDPAPLLRLAPRVLMWGAHKFGHLLPPGRHLVWDKRPNGQLRSQGCGEVAWTNVRPDAPVRMFRFLWDGLSTQGGYETRVERKGAAAAARVHPTQKPVDLMHWCISMLDLAPDSLICDPYMGGGSSGIAAVLAGHRFVGVECEPRYFDAACRRIEAAWRGAASA